MWVGCGSLALSSGVRWRSGAAGVENLYFNSIKLKIHLDIIAFTTEEYYITWHRMVMENRPVDPGSIQGSHQPISFIRIIDRTRADDILCKTEY